MGLSMDSCNLATSWKIAWFLVGPRCNNVELGGSRVEGCRIVVSQFSWSLLILLDDSMFTVVAPSYYRDCADNFFRMFRVQASVDSVRSSSLSFGDVCLRICTQGLVE